MQNNAEIIYNQTSPQNTLDYRYSNPQNNGLIWYSGDGDWLHVCFRAGQIEGFVVTAIVITVSF